MTKHSPWKDEGLVRQAFATVETTIDAFRVMGLSNPSSTTHYRNAQIYLPQYGISKPLVDRAKNAKRAIPKAAPLASILVENSTYTNMSSLKKRLFREGILENRCYNCGLTKWLGAPLSLHLEHIDGNPTNNLVHNLTILCPNCHSQTDSYCRKRSARSKKDKQAVRRSRKPRFDWPGHDVLESMVSEHGYRGTARIIGCSDNAVRKRLRQSPLA